MPSHFSRFSSFSSPSGNPAVMNLGGDDKTNTIHLSKVNIALSLQVLGRTLYFTDLSEIVPLYDQINFGSQAMCGVLLLHQSV